MLLPDGPDVARGPSRVTGRLGDEAELLCGRDLRSNPPATVRWSDSEGNIVDPDSRRASFVNGPTSISLLVRNLTEKDAGNWTCEISVEGVRTVLVSITLIVVGENLIYHQ